MSNDPSLVRILLLVAFFIRSQMQMQVQHAVCSLQLAACSMHHADARTACRCSMQMQHAGACSMQVQHGGSAWRCSMQVQHAGAACRFSMQVHPADAGAACRCTLQVQHAGPACSRTLNLSTVSMQSALSPACSRPVHLEPSELEDRQRQVRRVQGGLERDEWVKRAKIPHTPTPYVWGAMLAIATMRTHTSGTRCAPILYSKSHGKKQS